MSTKEYQTANFAGRWSGSTRCVIQQGQLGKSIARRPTTGDDDDDRYTQVQTIKRYYGSFGGYVSGADPLQDDWVVMQIDLDTGAGRYVAVADLEQQTLYPEFQQADGLWMTGLFTLVGYVHKGASAALVDHTANASLTAANAQSYNTNAGAPGTITLSLPGAPAAGLVMSFVVVAGYELRIDPGDNDKIIATGIGAADGKYIYSSTPGDRITLTSDSNGDWQASDQWPRGLGGWTREA